MLTKILTDLLPYHATLVAVSKTKSNEAILNLYNQGIRIFGENYVQELTAKQESLPKDIQWHFIGHLQTNKIKFIAPYISMIHSVDSLKMLEEIDKQGKRSGRVIDCLLQFHIAQEETKFGLDRLEADEILASSKFQSLHAVRVCGVMGMATFTENKEQVRKEFRSLKDTFDYLKSIYFPEALDFKHISMGMSDDYLMALEEGSTMVRIGSLLFGKRS